jgi:7,8-dihydropterin-6-yl-methyl-4-(beta-D-ribofuranosyl)aminobenzene 5'-phosphate synthase
MAAFRTVLEATAGNNGGIVVSEKIVQSFDRGKRVPDVVTIDGEDAYTTTIGVVTTDYETGLEGHHTWRGENVSHNPEIHDERFLAARVRGRGTTVFSACSHAGIVNVGLEARRIVPGHPIDLLLGGYHLAGAGVEDRIGPTVQGLADVAPRIVAPGHCTGWRASAALAEAFGPTGFAPSVVGTRYLLSGSP